MTMPTTPAAHKRFVTDDDRIDRVYVVKLGRPYPDDEPWLTNIYWAAPARWFQRFFDYYAPKGQRWSIMPGLWRPDGKTLQPFVDDPDDNTAALERATDMFAGLLTADTYTRPLTPVVVHGQHAHARCTAHFEWLAMFTDPDGESIAVRADWLEVLTGAGRPQDNLPSPYGYKWAPQLPHHLPTLRQQPGGPRKPVGVFLDRINIHDGHYEGDPGTPERRWVPRREDSPVPTLAAVIMPHLLPGLAGVNR
jgi:hypothetical protein